MINNSNSPITIDKFLEVFFSENNQFRLDKINNPKDSQAKIKPWIDKLTQPEPEYTVLPYWNQTSVTWYAITFSERELINLREKLIAFIGCTYSDFKGQIKILNLNNTLESDIFKLTKGRVFSFKGNTKKIWEKLEKMRQVEQQRKKIVANITQSADGIIKDFYTALEKNNREEAEKQLNILQQENKLDFLFSDC